VSAARLSFNLLNEPTGASEETISKLLRKAYEDFQGHKLDRKLLRLLQSYL